MKGLVLERLQCIIIKCRPPAKCQFIEIERRGKEKNAVCHGFIIKVQALNKEASYSRKQFECNLMFNPSKLPAMKDGIVISHA